MFRKFLNLLSVNKLTRVQGKAVRIPTDIPFAKKQTEGPCTLVHLFTRTLVYLYTCYVNTPNLQHSVSRYCYRIIKGFLLQKNFSNRAFL